MRLVKLEMNNFRQYYGPVSVEFSDGEKNVTIITGENGKGKTGIYRGIMYALYGARHIQQDDHREEIILVNRVVMDSNTRAEMSVKLIFEHQNKMYTVERHMVGMKANNKYVQQDGEVRLSITDEQGNYQPEYSNKDEVKIIIEEILSTEIKDFFLFDGEKIDTLVKTDDIFKKEVKTAIFKLLQIDNIDQGTKILKDMIRMENNAISKKSKNQDMEKVYAKVKELEVKIDKNNIKINELNTELLTSESITANFDIQLTRSDDIKDIQSQIKGVQDQIKLLDELKIETEKSLRKTLLENGVEFLMKNDFIKTVEYLSRSRQDIRESLSLEVIDFTLKSGICACCNNNLSEHRQNLEFVENLRKKILLASPSSFNNDLINNYKNFVEDSQQSEEELRSILININKTNDKVSNLTLQVKSLTEEIGSTASQNMEHKQIHEALIKQTEITGSLKEQIRSSSSSLDQLESQLEVANNDYKQIREMEGRLEKDGQVVLILEEALRELSKINVEFNNEIRALLNEKTTKLFKKLIDSKDYELVKNVVINDKFEIVTIGKDDMELTQDISQGQRHIMSLAFILSLAIIASDDNENIGYPLFMDSPFNRLSIENRKNLIKSVPTMSKQWILLLTDSELTNSEINEFDSGNKVGNVYHIVQVEPFIAKIEKTTLGSPFLKGGLN